MIIIDKGRPRPLEGRTRFQAGPAQSFFPVIEIERRAAGLADRV